MAYTNPFILSENPFLLRHIISSPHPQQKPFLGQNFDFDYLIVVDFEATCLKDRIPHPQEIIEFPSVIVNGETGQILCCFQTYVRPTCNPVLSDFCKELTGIQQDQVNESITLPEALLLHHNWLLQMGIMNTNFSVVTWSNWDCQVMLESECQFKRIQKPAYFNQWINLRIPFSKVFGDVRCNLKQAVEISGLVWQGRVHSGLDDSINIARLLAVIMSRGFKLSITKSLMPQATPNSRTQQFLEPHASAIPESVEFRYCFCGAKSFKNTIQKPGPKYGSSFFGCGKWTSMKGACCNFFLWATS